LARDDRGGKGGGEKTGSKARKFDLDAAVLKKPTNPKISRQKSNQETGKRCGTKSIHTWESSSSSSSIEVGVLCAWWMDVLVWWLPRRAFALPCRYPAATSTTPPISPCLTMPYLQISGRTYCYVRIYLFGEMIFYYRVCTQMRFNYTSFGVQYCIYEWLKLLRGRF
jgi:hypothetical protein